MARVTPHLILGLALATCCGCTSGFSQRALLYHPEKTSSVGLSPPGDEIQSITATTADGLTLHGWHYSASLDRDRPLRDAERVVLYFSGNAGNRNYRVGECLMLKKLGCDVVIFDYRGFGDNDGETGEPGFALDAEAMWREVVELQGVAPSKVVLYGESLGGAIATRLAESKCEAGTPPAGLVLRSTFASMTETAGHHAWFVPVSLLLADRYPSDQRIKHVTCPVLQIHGNADTLVTMEMAERLHNAAPERSDSGLAKKLVVIPGAGHNDVLEVGRELYQREVRNFLQRL
jgi:fermentation-respiration switch protein FrsA (DUF1100 family)